MQVSRHAPLRFVLGGTGVATEAALLRAQAFAPRGLPRSVHGRWSGRPSARAGPRPGVSVGLSPALVTGAWRVEGPGRCPRRLSPGPTLGVLGPDRHVCASVPDKALPCPTNGALQLRRESPALGRPWPERVAACPGRGGVRHVFLSRVPPVTCSLKEQA